MAVKDWKTNPDENTTISGIDIAEGCAPSMINNAIRQVMADIKANAEEQEDTFSKEMTGASDTADGTSGNVPAPKKGQQNKPFRGDGTFGDTLDCTTSGNLPINADGTVSNLKLAKENEESEGGQVEFESPNGNNIILDMFYDEENAERLLRIFSALALKYIIKFNIDSGTIESENAITNAVYGNADNLQLLAARLLEKSAILSLFSTDNTDNPGAFALSAIAGGVRRYFVGTSSGGLTWDGATVPVVSGGSDKGRVVSVGVVGNSYQLPAGGSWVYVIFSTNASGELTNQLAGVQAGGASVSISGASILRGFAWRVV